MQSKAGFCLCQLQASSFSEDGISRKIKQECRWTWQSSGDRFVGMLAHGAQQQSCPRPFSWCCRGERLFFFSASFFPASYWGSHLLRFSSSKRCKGWSWLNLQLKTDQKNPPDRDCPLLNVKWKWGFGRMHIGVCHSLMFLMPPLAKFRAVSSPSQKTINVKKKTWWSGVVGSPQTTGQYPLQCPCFGSLNSLACGC